MLVIVVVVVVIVFAVVVVVAMEVVESSVKKFAESARKMRDYLSASSTAVIPPVMETFLASKPDISRSRMSASVLRRKMTGSLSVREDLTEEIYPGCVLIGPATTLLCSHWSRAS